MHLETTKSGLQFINYNGESDWEISFKNLPRLYPLWGENLLEAQRPPTIRIDEFLTVFTCAQGTKVCFKFKGTEYCTVDLYQLKEMVLDKIAEVERAPFVVSLSIGYRNVLTFVGKSHFKDAPVTTAYETLLPDEVRKLIPKLWEFYASFKPVYLKYFVIEQSKHEAKYLTIRINGANVVAHRLVSKEEVLIKCLEIASAEGDYESFNTYNISVENIKMGGFLHKDVQRTTTTVNDIIKYYRRQKDYRDHPELARIGVENVEMCFKDYYTVGDQAAKVLFDEVNLRWYYYRIKRIDGKTYVGEIL